MCTLTEQFTKSRFCLACLGQQPGTQKGLRREQNGTCVKKARTAKRTERNVCKESKVTCMRQSTVDTASIQHSADHREKTEFMPQGGDVALDLSRRLESFRRTHPYKEIQVEGQRWRYMVGGQSERTLLLFPGGTLVPDTYFILLEELEHDYHVIVPAYAAVPTMAELVTGAAAILDAEGIERVDVMGSSFGGYVAQCFVRAHPDRVDRLILAVTGVRHFVSRATPLYLLAQFMKVLPASAVRFMMWRLWSTLVTTSSEEQAFWLGLLKEILTTTAQQSQPGQRNRRDLRLCRTLPFQQWRPGCLAWQDSHPGIRPG